MSEIPLIVINVFPRTGPSTENISKFYLRVLTAVASRGAISLNSRTIQPYCLIFTFATERSSSIRFGGSPGRVEKRPVSVAETRLGSPGPRFCAWRIFMNSLTSRCDSTLSETSRDMPTWGQRSSTKRRIWYETSTVASIDTVLPANSLGAAAIAQTVVCRTCDELAHDDGAARNMPTKNKLQMPPPLRFHADVRTANYSSESTRSPLLR
jgi:hypothetical protein